MERARPVQLLLDCFCLSLILRCDISQHELDKVSCLSTAGDAEPLPPTLQIRPSADKLRHRPPFGAESAHCNGKLDEFCDAERASRDLAQGPVPSLIAGNRVFGAERLGNLAPGRVALWLRRVLSLSGRRFDPVRDRGEGRQRQRLCIRGSAGFVSNRRKIQRVLQIKDGLHVLVKTPQPVFLHQPGQENVLFRRPLVVSLWFALASKDRRGHVRTRVQRPVY